ncbi:hypothetical protein [Chitinophaga flava]|uniref:Uncharacterized protein n=1 Tax=Chitinophaga flava TaxID=2259036 RepID=A0A365Y588_9BACT|nr:hypothetical protein [Chitinophaga flava]RBL93498.1 hypothetical protein DF182_13375 [Chitinophaga flava]
MINGVDDNLPESGSFVQSLQITALFAREFSLAASLVGLVCMIVWIMTWRLAVMNPVKSLRTE